ncbi:uncharacterized protein LOC106084348 [Stomoxys calcitrans]|uniref:Uncharacterized protein n=1 Tax=Stomoxys calcitrans TaxID=35570 RepID=A0A1I8PUX5_STOCA|nr:uncharacterized protein LOC106084348 [Stomoxys calcitrans]
MSLRTRTLIFSTFFGSCIAIGLLLGSLTTDNWVRANPKRGNSTNSEGEVHFGLFYGSKVLDSGFGKRITPVEVYTFIQTEPESMNFWLWLFTAIGAGLGLLSCAISAIAAVFKSASSSKGPVNMLVLIASNISSAVTQIVAFICWLVQFIQYLQHNVLAVADHKHHWYSSGLASLGYSFYMVILSTLVVLINISILLYARHCDRRDRQRLEAPSEKKNECAIMLY